MKKFIFSSLLLILFLFTLTRLSSAQEELSIKESSSSAETGAGKKVEYDLPYPGILPDSPLYFLKVFRDFTIDFLISDSLKKANFYLLQADKRLNAGIYLIESKKKYELAESTISKGENYFEKAIGKVKEAKNQGMNISGIKEKLDFSLQKHQEVIANMIAIVPSQTKPSFETLIKKMQSFDKQAESLN